MSRNINVPVHLWLLQCIQDTFTNPLAELYNQQGIYTCTSLYDHALVSKNNDINRYPMRKNRQVLHSAMHEKSDVIFSLMVIIQFSVLRLYAMFFLFVQCFCDVVDPNQDVD